MVQLFAHCICINIETSFSLQFRSDISTMHGFSYSSRDASVFRKDVTLLMTLCVRIKELIIE